MIKQSTGDNEEARLAAHAVVGSVLAHLQGNSAVAGGAGALTGEIAADLIMQQLYPGKWSVNSARQKTDHQRVKYISSRAGGGFDGRQQRRRGCGCTGWENAVENNALGSLGDIFGSQGAKYFEGRVR